MSSASIFLCDASSDPAFAAPERPWVEVTPTTFNKDAKLAFLRRNPDVFCIVLAENGSLLPDFSLEDFYELVDANLRSVATKIELGEKEYLARLSSS